MPSLEKDITDIFELMEKKCDKALLPLLQAYKKELIKLREEIYKIYGKYTVEGELNISTQHRLKILKDIEKQLIMMATSLSKIENSIVADMLKNTYEETYYRTTYVIDNSSNFKMDFSLLNEKFINEAVFQNFRGEMFSDRIWSNKELLVNRLNDIITTAIVQGKSVNKVAKEITNTFNSSAYESKRLARTEMARVVSQAQEKIYQESDLVISVLFCATLDFRTSEICRSKDGKIYDKYNAPHIPLHPNCRSCLIPIVDGYKPTERMDNITKEKIKYKTYNEWYKDKVK